MRGGYNDVVFRGLTGQGQGQGQPDRDRDRGRGGEGEREKREEGVKVGQSM